MCVNYQPVTRQLLNSHFQAPMQTDADWKAETWQDYPAPIIVGDNHGRRSLLGLYSMIPKIQLPPGIKRFSTMNARAETLGTLRSYAKPWRCSQLCLVPMMAFYEPNYESGKAERWRISMADDAPFAVAGLYRSWQDNQETWSYSFTQITINADNHPLMRRFHQPGEEKRSLVIIPPTYYDVWLTCRQPEKALSLLTQYPAEYMRASAAPKMAARSRNRELF